MIKTIAVLAALLPSVAYASDKVLVLSDAEQRELIQVLDAALKGYGAAVGSQAGHIIDKLNAAPVVVPKPENKPAPTPPAPPMTNETQDHAP